MKKISKYILGITAVGAAIAGVIYLSKKQTPEDVEEMFSDDFEDEDFDLDDDLGPVSEREYVSLNPEAASEPKEAESPQEEAPETSEETETTEE